MVGWVAAFWQPNINPIQRILLGWLSPAQPTPL